MDPTHRNSFGLFFSIHLKSIKIHTTTSACFFRTAFFLLYTWPITRNNWSAKVEQYTESYHIYRCDRHVPKHVTGCNSKRRRVSEKMDVDLTPWGRDKWAAIFKTIFWNGFSLMKRFEFGLKFHWGLILMVYLTIFQHWFRKWLNADQA